MSLEDKWSSYLNHYKRHMTISMVHNPIIHRFKSSIVYKDSFLMTKIYCLMVNKSRSWNSIEHRYHKYNHILFVYKLINYIYTHNWLFIIIIITIAPLIMSVTFAQIILLSITSWACTTILLNFKIKKILQNNKIFLSPT